MLRWVETTAESVTGWGKLLYSAAKNQIQSQSGLFQGTLVDSRIIFIENTTFILICYQVHNDSWKYTYHYKSHSWKQPCLYILLGSIQNEKIDTLLNKWYKKILYVERFNFLLTNLHFLVTASRAIIALKERSIASKSLLWQKASGGWGQCISSPVLKIFILLHYLRGKDWGEDKTKVAVFHFWEYELNFQRKKYLHSHCTQMLLQKGKCIEKRICWKLSDASCSSDILPRSRGSQRK